MWRLLYITSVFYHSACRMSNDYNYTNDNEIYNDDSDYDGDGVY